MATIEALEKCSDGELAAHIRKGRKDAFAELLRRYERELYGYLRRYVRDANLAELRGLSLSPADLARRGRHPALGPVTLAQLLAAWVVHDLNHVAQVCKALAFQHRQEVGPWEAYLSILAPPSPR